MTTKSHIKWRSIAMLLTIGLLSGCVPWPRDEYDAKVYYSNCQLAQDRYTQVSLFNRLVAKRRWLESLRYKGARSCFPGRWETANAIALRIQNEINAGHFYNANQDLYELNIQLGQLQHSLRYINPRVSCRQTNLPPQIPNLYRKGW